MSDKCDGCLHERVHKVEYRQLTQNIGELKERVGRVETTLARGVLLLVANLVAMVMSLTRQFLQG